MESFSLLWIGRLSAPKGKKKADLHRSVVMLQLWSPEWSKERVQIGGNNKMYFFSVLVQILFDTFIKKKLFPGWQWYQRLFLDLFLVLPAPLSHVTFILTTALWGGPTQTNTWGLLRGKTRATVRATELAPDPLAAIPAAKEATGKRHVKILSLVSSEITWCFPSTCVGGCLCLDYRFIHQKTYWSPYKARLSQWFTWR